MPEVVRLFTEYLKSGNLVNQSYAAACIEKMLIKKSSTTPNTTVLNDKNIDQTLLSNLLQNLCMLLNDNRDLYAIRALLRVINLSKQNLVPFAETLGGVLYQFIDEAVRDE